MIKSFLKFLKSKDFKEFLLFNLIGAIIIGFCLLFLKCTANASSLENNFYFPMEQNENLNIPQDLIQYMEILLDAENNFIFIAPWGNGYYWYCYAPKGNGDLNIFGEIYNNDYQFKLYTTSNSSHGGYIAWWNGENAGIWDTGFNYINNGNPFNSSLYDTSMSYVSNFRILTNNTNSANVILKYGWELPPDFLHDTSHATPPDTFEVPVYTTGHTPPTNVPPTYTINNYTWTTYNAPTLDTSNAEALLESIYNAIVYNGQYLKDNIHGELTNLVNNIGGFFEYIGDTIQYYGNLIISNIQNGITTFYNNINSAIVGIGNAVGYITQPLDMDNLTNAVNSTSIWGDVDTCTTYANDAFGIYGTVAEPNTFKIPLDLRSISLLNITQVYYIDLSWLDGVKSAIRAFMWCVVTFGLLYSIIVDIPNMIRSSK